MAKLLRNFNDFSGGLSEVSNDNMKDNQLALAINTTPGESHGIAKATGTEIAFEQIHTTTKADGKNEPVLELLELKTPTASEILAFTSSALYRRDLTSGTYSWSNITQTPLGSIGAIKDYFIHANKLWWFDGTQFYCYDGKDGDGPKIVTMTVETSTAAAEDDDAAREEFWDRVRRTTSVVQRGKRWFYSRPGSNEVLFSELNDPAGFQLTNIINVNTKNADTITGLEEFNDGILIFKRKSVHYLTGWDLASGSDIQLTQLNVTSGTMFPKSVQRVENAVLYLGYDGLYQLKIPYLSTILAAENIADKRIAKTLEKNNTTDAWATVWGGVYYLTIQNEQEVKEYRYYLNIKAFFGEFTQTCRCYSNALENNNLYLGCDNGYILLYDDNSYHYVDADTGEPVEIEMKARTKGFDVAGMMVADAKVKRVFVVAKQFETVTSCPDIEIRADYKAKAFGMDFDESLVYAKGDWGRTRWGFISTVTKEIPVNYKAKRVQFTFSNDSMDEATLIYGIGVRYKQKRPRGNREGITEKRIVYDED